jgi:putative heme-binding domain-containing protein
VPVRHTAIITASAVALAAAAGWVLVDRGRADEPAAKKPAKKAKRPAADPAAPEPAATAPETLKVAKGFRVELLHSVPKDKQGSWVNLCTDPKGRLIASDQYGGLYRITPPALGGKAEDTKIEKIPAPIGEAQGLLWAFDSLYVVVNRGGKYQSGLYRVTASKDPDVLDTVTMLRKLDGGAEHGPHAVIPSPDGKTLTVVCGNNTQLTETVASRVPRIWGEDHLLPRMPDGRGFMAGKLGPGGAIYRVSPDGKAWELIAVGFRNQFDAAYNRDGELFTYDADMEWDMNTPWYRPTRVCLVASGAEFGWRNGAGKWPSYYADSLPSVVDVGPGSPTGVCFGYGAKFPAKYRDALFIADWSYGKIYATHLSPDGAAYKGQLEEFVAGTPLQVTDLIINPTDGAMYFAIGGRKTKSGLYRVTYVGDEPTAPTPPPAPDAGAELRALRHKLEAFHGKADSAALDAAWPYLGHADRYVRFAARTAIEHQPVGSWADRALAEKDPAAALTALLALVRASHPCPQHKKAPVDEALKAKVLDALEKFDWAKLTETQRLELLRIHHIAFNRMGRPDEAVRQRVISRLDAAYPAGSRFVDAELCQVLVYLEAPGVVGKTLKLLSAAVTQEEQIEYARALRVAKTGWTMEQRKEYFGWIVRAGGYKGGNSFGGFLKRIRDDAVATLTDAEKAELKPLLEAKPPENATAVPARPFVKKWTMDDLTPLLEKGLAGGRSFDRGRAMFAAAQCYSCHRFGNDGGAQAPDLTGAAGRFSARDLLESVIHPSKEISDQYAAVMFKLDDESIVVGRIVNQNGEGIMVNTNMLDPNLMVRIPVNRIEETRPSPKSMMPEGLLDTLNAEEILDLLAFVLSRGDKAHAAFGPAK